MSTKKIAIYGLGNMGYLVAERVSKNFSLLVADLDAVQKKRACDQLGAVAIETPEDIAQADVVVLCLPSPAASRAVLEQIGPFLSKGTVIVETSTVNPIDV